MLQELTVISGKGGTGKTSLVAAFAALAHNSIFADCDVDAADLHLILDPTITRREDFSGGYAAQIDQKNCSSCGKCLEICRFDAIGKDSRHFLVDRVACEGCGVCAHFCPQQCIAFQPVINGQWFISATRFGTMVHAKLGVAEENSGKLVGLVRKQARELAQEQNRQLLLVDGPPGIGCPVIASITGTDRVLIVTEPTMSGLHDLKRVAGLARHFSVPAMVCLNKWDINPHMSEQIRTEAQNLGVPVVGRVRYDKAVTLAQVQGQALTEFSSGHAAEDVKELWHKLCEIMAIEV